jgi:hypothetical protein
MRPDLRHIRLGCTVLCATPALLLVIPWMRSYWLVDVVAPRWFYPWRIQVVSKNGGVLVFEPRRFGTAPDVFWGWSSRWIETTDLDIIGPSVLGFRFPEFEPYVGIPYWCPVATLAILAALPWLVLAALSWLRFLTLCWPKRFSLRTLLIATTAVAVALGLVVWLNSKGGLSEKRVLAIARDAVEKREKTVSGVEFDKPFHRADGGWIAIVWLGNRHRIICIDVDGKVTSYEHAI